MHGSDSDVTWLQKDFGIYVVNLFDTGQVGRGGGEGGGEEVPFSPTGALGRVDMPFLRRRSLSLSFSLSSRNLFGT